MSQTTRGEPPTFTLYFSYGPGSGLILIRTEFLSTTGPDPVVASNEPDNKRRTADLPTSHGVRHLACVMLAFAALGRRSSKTATGHGKLACRGDVIFAKFSDLIRTNPKPRWVHNIFGPEYTVGFDEQQDLKEVIWTEGAHLYLNPEVLSPANISVFLDKEMVGDPSQLEVMREKIKGGLSQPPTGALPADDRYRIDRPQDGPLLAAVVAGVGIIRLQGPRQFGKSTTLALVKHKCVRKKMTVVVTDLQSLDEADLRTLDAFYHSVAERMLEDIGDAATIDIDAVWKTGRSAGSNFEAFLRQILRALPGQLLWMIDEVDRIFPEGHLEDVFRHIRARFNARALRPEQPWKRLTVVLAYANDPRNFIKNIKESPFNVGTSLKLGVFTDGEVAKLLDQRMDAKGPMERARFLRLLSGPFLGGHPYLVHYGLYTIVERDLAPDVFRTQAPEIFASHLASQINQVKDDAGMLKFIHLLLNERLPNEKDSTPEQEVAFTRLRALGILAGDSAATAHILCDLYEEFFRSRI